MLIDITQAPINSIVKTYSGSYLKILSKSKTHVFVMDIETKKKFVTNCILIIKSEIIINKN